MRSYGTKPRTQANRLQDAMAFIGGAWPHMLLSMTPDRLCELCGVTRLEDRQRVEVALMAAQDKERARD